MKVLKAIWEGYLGILSFLTWWVFNSIYSDLEKGKVNFAFAPIAIYLHFFSIPLWVYEYFKKQPSNPPPEKPEE